ncbi:MAG TPA: TIGR03435 family protein [Bryobacteraceae bacterium]|nr:TIGR03435 family protein [Bryobacteraceae bacterium]
MMLRRAILFAAAIPCLFAQTKKFDVASIKASPKDDNRFMLGLPRGGTFRATGVTVKMLIMSAYQVNAYQVSGGPSWIATERWDIQAKTDAAQGLMPRDQFDAMLQALLLDRLQLKVRRETKEMPVYALAVAKGGSKLTPHSGDPPKPEDRMRVGFGSMQFQASGLGLLAYQLSLQLGRTVIDKTGLTGQYDFRLEWAPEPGQGGPESIGLPPDPSLKFPPADPNRPSLFTAIREQLGLRLDSEQGPVDMIVIDSVSKPTEN